MEKKTDKYTVYGRKKGRKQIHLVDKDFIVNYKSNNPIIKSWILRCKKFDNKTFDIRYLLYLANYPKQ